MLQPVEKLALASCAARLGKNDNQRDNRNDSWIQNAVLEAFDPRGELFLSKSEVAIVVRSYCQGLASP